MNDRELENELAANNPAPDRVVRSIVPPAVGDAMLREITATGRSTFWQRMLAPIGVDRGPARIGFLGVVAVIALAAVGLTVAALGGEVATGPADEGAGDEAERPVPPPQPDQTPTPTVEVGPSPSASDPDSDPAPNTNADPDESAATGQPTGSAVTSTPAGPCVASGPSLDAAAAAYARECAGARADCDPDGDGWICSSEMIGDRSPAPPPSPATNGTGGSCIVIEAETIELTGQWRIRSDEAASGGRYIVWEGLAAGRHNDAPADILSVPIDVPAAGSYRFTWAMRQPDEVADETANDSWVDVPDADRFGPVGGGTYGGFVTVVGHGKGSFTWSASADHNGARSQIAIEFARPGRYTLQLAGRSNGHQLDRIVLHHEAVARADATAGRCGDRGSPTADPDDGGIPDIAGPFDPATDLISLHYDHAPERDDGQATVAGRVVTDALGLTPWVIGGAYGTNAAAYQPASELVMDATWGLEGWVDAHRDRDGAVAATADRWQATLSAGGAVWVAEGGQSDLTADVVRELAQRMPELDTSRVHVVQHSDRNERTTTAADLRYVRETTDYIRIEDGNWRNGTADLNTITPGFAERALAGEWRDAWTAAFDYLDPDERLDFSDTVELLHIVGIGTDEIATTEDFANRFLG